jgi:hypothetical protein
MSCSANAKVWELATNELIGLDGGRGTTLRVTRGTLWVTLEHDTRDVVLEVGDVFTVDRGGLTLMQAHGETTVCVEAHHVEARRIGAGTEPPAARWRRRFAAIVNAGFARRWAPHA